MRVRKLLFCALAATLLCGTATQGARAAKAETVAEVTEEEGKEEDSKKEEADAAKASGLAGAEDGKAEKEAESKESSEEKGAEAEEKKEDKKDKEDKEEEKADKDKTDKDEEKAEKGKTDKDEKKADKDKADKEEKKASEKKFSEKEEKDEKAAKEESTKKSAKEPTKKASYTKEDLRLLSSLIFCEAGSEPYAGKLAVGIVVMNRKASHSFPGTVRGVIYQKYQFGPASNGALSHALAQYDAGKFTTSNHRDCVKAAKAALEGAKSVTYGGKEISMKSMLYFSGRVSGARLSIGRHQFK